MPPPALLAVGLVLGFLVLIPARRLQLAGFSGRAIGAYAAGLWALSFLVAVRPVAIRVLVPILLVAYIAPFIVAPGRLARIVRRGQPPKGPGPSGPSDRPMKNVTPPDPDEPTGAP